MLPGERGVQGDEEAVEHDAEDQAEDAAGGEPEANVVQPGGDQGGHRPEALVEHELAGRLGDFLGVGDESFFKRVPQEQRGREGRQDVSPQLHGGQAFHERSDLTAVDRQDDRGHQVVNDDAHAHGVTFQRGEWVLTTLQYRPVRCSVNLCPRAPF